MYKIVNKVILIMALMAASLPSFAQTIVETPTPAGGTLIVTAIFPDPTWVVNIPEKAYITVTWVDAEGDTQSYTKDGTRDTGSNDYKWDFVPIVVPVSDVEYRVWGENGSLKTVHQTCVSLYLEGAMTITIDKNSWNECLTAWHIIKKPEAGTD